MVYLCSRPHSLITRLFIGGSDHPKQPEPTTYKPYCNQGGMVERKVCKERWSWNVTLLIQGLHVLLQPNVIQESSYGLYPIEQQD